MPSLYVSVLTATLLAILLTSVVNRQVRQVRSTTYNAGMKKPIGTPPKFVNCREAHPTNFPTDLRINKNNNSTSYINGNGASRSLLQLLFHIELSNIKLCT